LKLLPYLTANLQFRVDQRDDSLLVPNAALRYRPPAERVAPEFRSAYEQSRRRRAAAPVMSPGPAKARESRATACVEDDGFGRPVKIRIGLTDGVSTEVLQVLEGELSEGTELVTGEKQASVDGTSNPFAPKMMGGKKKE